MKISVVVRNSSFEQGQCILKGKFNKKLEGAGPSKTSKNLNKGDSAPLNHPRDYPWYAHSQIIMGTSKTCILANSVIAECLSRGQFYSLFKNIAVIAVNTGCTDLLSMGFFK